MFVDNESRYLKFEIGQVQNGKTIMEAHNYFK